jgi:hypothetical protein
MAGQSRADRIGVVMEVRGKRGYIRNGAEGRVGKSKEGEGREGRAGRMRAGPDRDVKD